MNWQCLLGHSYGPWSLSATAERSLRNGLWSEQELSELMVLKRRKCRRCGRVQQRVMEMGIEDASAGRRGRLAGPS